MPKTKALNRIKLNAKIEVRTSDQYGDGVFALIDFDKDDYIGTYEGERAKNNSKFVLWLVDGKKQSGRRGSNELRFINHSKKPNAEFRDWDLHARKKIRVGDEITFDYDPTSD